MATKRSNRPSPSKSATAGPTPPNSAERPERVHAPLARDVDEPAAVVSEQAVGVAVLIGDEEIQIAVAVDVEPHGADGLARIADARRGRHVGEAAAVVAKQPVRLIAERDEQVEVAVVVVVDPRRLAAHADQIQAERRRDVGEMPVAVVVIELVVRTADEADVEIDVAVRVVVAPRRDARLDVVGNPGGGGDIREAAVILPVESIRPAAEADELVQLPVVVEIRPRVRLSARRAEELRLHELEGRRVVGAGGDCAAVAVRTAGGRED